MDLKELKVIIMDLFNNRADKEAGKCLLRLRRKVETLKSLSM
jgi:hypothetical protein